jgi:DNA helicase-2/ATP-dependent DNA helicase PcrA
MRRSSDHPSRPFVDAYRLSSLRCSGSFLSAKRQGSQTQGKGLRYTCLPRREAWQNNIVMAGALNLNPEQRRAVEYGEGPLLVIAGPGSGKTRVITHRIVHLLERAAGARPEHILALTFTEKAAGEMESRVRKEVPGLQTSPFIATFHAFCYHVLRERHFDRQLLDKIDVWIFLRRRMQQLALEFYQKLAEPGAFLHDLNEFFSRCQDELIGPAQFEAYVRKLEERSSCAAPARPPSGESRSFAALRMTSPDGATSDPAERKVLQDEVHKRKELARVFRRSRELIEQAGCSSLGSLISETVALWDREPATLERCRQRFRFVLVDEFQDSNYAQVELLRRLVVPPFNITAVGDADQAIYRFRGASHGAFQMFDQVFPGHETVYMDRNYRSTRKILRVADAVIASNDRYQGPRPNGPVPTACGSPLEDSAVIGTGCRSPLEDSAVIGTGSREVSGKPALKTDNPEGRNVYLLDAPDYPSEAAWVAEEVLRLTRRGRAFGEMAVLYRSHNYRDLLVEEFRRRSVPFNIRGLSVLSTTILRDLVAYVNLIHSPHHNVSLTRVLLAPRWRFPEELALDIRKQAAKDRCSLFDMLEARERSGELDSTAWSELKALLKSLRSAARHASVSLLFDKLVDRLEVSFLPGDRDQIYVQAFRKFLGTWEEKSESGILGAPLASRDDGSSSSPRHGDVKPSLQEFMEYFGYFREAGGQIEAPELDDRTDAVQMMTAHAAKGLEFPIVFVVSVGRQRFPHREETPVIDFPDELRKGPPAPPNIHLQEERRLFYVAMTRARERLYISSVAKNRPSIFVEELLDHPVVASSDIERIAVPVVGEGRGASPFAVRDSGSGVRGRVPRPETQNSNPESRTPNPEKVSPQSAPRAPLQRNLFEDAALAAPTHLAAVHPPLSEWVSRPPAEAADGKLMLSASTIEAYRDCPLKFKFIHYFRIPTAPQAALTFGNLMHQCVRHYYVLRREGVPQAEDLEAFYRRSWNAAGFEDAYQEEAYKKAGLEQLRRFVERQRENLIPADQIQTEQRFRMGLRDVVLHGRIDQINPCDGSVELVDYKTGRPRSQKDADKSLQLSVYALAARRELHMDPARLTFYNLTSNEAVSTVRTNKDLERALAEINDVAARIRQRLFDPSPGFVCKRCEFVPICPAHEGQ